MFLNSQKNLLYKAIKEQDLLLRDFTLAETPKSEEDIEGLKVIHKPTGFYFRLAIRHAQVDQNRRVVPGMYLYSSPIREGFVVTEGERNTHAEVKDWNTAAAVLSHWLSWLKKEVLEEPDLWVTLENTPNVFSEDVAITDDSFTPAELKLLPGQIEEATKYISSLELPVEAEEAINEALREIPPKSKRLTKKELSEVVFSTVVKECFKWGLTADHLQSIWLGCKHLFIIANTMLK